MLSTARNVSPNSPNQASNVPLMESCMPTASTDSSVYAPELQETASSILYYAQYMAPIMPFVPIPPNISPNVLLKEHPFKSLAMNLVSCKNPLRRREATKAIGQYIANHIIIQAESSIDLLQGLLIYISWLVIQ